MRKIRMGVAAFALAAGTVWGVPAYADICDHLAAKIAQYQAEEGDIQQFIESQITDSSAFATAPGRSQRAQLIYRSSDLAQVRRTRARYEREYARKNCGEIAAARSAATGAALGAIGFGIMSGAMGGGYRGSSGGSGGSGYGRRSSYPSGGSSGSYRRY